MPPEPSIAAAADRFLEALHAASHAIGLAADNPRPLRLHGSAIYLLPDAAVVARLIKATDENLARATTALRVTGWLVRQGFPCVQPAHGSIVEACGSAVSFWHYLPQPENAGPPRVDVLGQLLRQLHNMPRPPLELPSIDPLARLRHAIGLDTARQAPLLPPEQLVYLQRRVAALASAYEALAFPLGIGLIHNDPHPGNLLIDPRSPYGYVLADWDGAGLGPRETDLVQEGAPGNRFGETEERRQAFSNAYGYDIATWPSWPILREIRDLHSLAAYIRAAPEKTAARTELQRRIASLQSGDRECRWKAVR
jgi:aminoglycoside phosphotransferase (APT) family kinase protein